MFLRSFENVAPGDCQFNDSWTLTGEYVRWISRPKDAHKARCMLCLKDIERNGSNGRKSLKINASVLKSHGKVLEFSLQKQMGTLFLLCTDCPEQHGLVMGH